MTNAKRRFLSALGIWAACVIGFFVVSLAFSQQHIWSKSDFLWVAELAGCGLVIVGTIALLSQRLRRLVGVIVGAVCGLLPSILLVAWATLVRPGFEESAGAVGFAVMLAAPSAVGGALAGFVCSRRTRRSAAAYPNACNL